MTFHSYLLCVSLFRKISGGIKSITTTGAPLRLGTEPRDYPSWEWGGGRKEKKILPKVGSGGLPSTGDAGAEPLKDVVFDGKR